MPCCACFCIPQIFCLLDEPTNHLDMRAKDILLNALMDYTGTVVFVSHDRYFIDKLATRVFEIGDGKVEVYPGNYEDFLWRKEGGAEKLQETVSLDIMVQPANGNRTEAISAENKSKRLNPIKRKQMEERSKHSKPRFPVRSPRSPSAKLRCKTSSAPRKLPDVRKN